MDILYQNTINQYVRETAGCTLTITKVNYESTGYGICEATVTEIDDEKVSIRAYLITEFENYFDIGDSVHLTAEITPSRSENSLSDSYLLSKGFFLQLTSSDSNSVQFLASNTSVFPYTTISEIGHKIYICLLRFLSSDSAAMVRALLCGDKSSLSTSIREDFKLLGISHILAVSGLHIGILVGSLTLLGKKCKLGKKQLFLPILIFSALYMGICSFTPSVCRAFGMTALFTLASPMGRKNDGVTTLFSAVTVLCLLSPYAILDIGLLLSCSATFGILTVGIPLTQKANRITWKPLRWMVNTLAITYAANLFTLPFSVLTFGYFSILTPLSNLIFIPLITLILYGSPILLLLSVFPPLATAWGWILDFLCQSVTWLAEWMSRSEYLLVFRNSLFLWLLIPLYFFILLAFWYLPKHRLLPGILVICYLTASFLEEWNYPLTTPEITFYSDGKNDAILVRGGRTAILLDNSNGGYTFWSDCLSLADGYGITVDTLLLTHYHYYQISGLSKLLQNSDISTLLLPLSEKKNSSFERLSAIAQENNCQITYFESQVVYQEQEIFIYTAYLNRSVHTCTGYQILTEQEEWDYVSFAMAEDSYGKDLLDSFSQADTLIIGVHGPKIKTELDLPEDFSGELLFSNEDLESQTNR
jgi:ComEC/Rec2-related protein